MRARLRNTLAPLAAVAFLLSVCMARAEELPVAKQIDHLIAFVRASPCIFIRNGAEYDGAAAVGHIQQKYDYYRDEIHSVEDFIDLAATRSAFSGKPYEVRCPGRQAVPAAEWLRAELQAFRAKNGGN